MIEAVLIAIRPEYCKLIVSGEKTIEVRKTRPKRETPFKCYIYCTKGKPLLYCRPSQRIGNGLVIGEFVCGRIIEWNYIPDLDESSDPGSMSYDVLTVDGEKTGMGYDDFEGYGKGSPLFGWHISNLKIYDEPKKLSEFRLYYSRVVYEDGFPMPTREIERPPQSWLYVKELTEAGDS